MGIENASVVLNIHFQFVVMSLESHASPKKPFEITVPCLGLYANAGS